MGGAAEGASHKGHGDPLLTGRGIDRKVKKITHFRIRSKVAELHTS